jgi:CDP-glucose 4,6-dehydratase
VAGGQSAVEGLVVSFWTGKRVLITGHTGFKGSWLSLWLAQHGAHVTGLALPPETTPSLFDQLGLVGEIDHRIGDVCDAGLVAAVVREASPDVVFHLAAQSLVLRGYRTPVETWQTNVMGTINVLEALRVRDKPCAAVLVTTDKVYENREWEFGYRESDPLGGHDPYSASKAGAEIAIASWRSSYFHGASPVRIASVRAGNVIGGGDWCENRIVPDMIRALSAGQPVRVRNPRAVRPWQHVLEPLGGYLMLGQRLMESDDRRYQDAFNFGPTSEAVRNVRALVEEGLRHWPGVIEDASDPNQPHEAGQLALSIDRACTRLGWMPRWDFERTVAETMTWYRGALEGDAAGIRERSLASIRAYEAMTASGGRV